MPAEGDQGVPATKILFSNRNYESDILLSFFQVDLFFYREPEETKEPGEDDAPAADFAPEYGATPALGLAPTAAATEWEQGGATDWDGAAPPAAAPPAAAADWNAAAPPAAQEWSGAAAPAASGKATVSRFLEGLFVLRRCGCS